MLLRRVLLLLGLVAAASACGGAASGQGVEPPATAAVGGLPGVPTTQTASTAATSSTVVRTTVPIPVESQIGARVADNRVILIGDSVMASTSQRYGDEMCQALVPLGWQTEVDAETGRFIDFGGQVLDARLPAGWDVSVILLGNNYGERQDVYRQYLDAMIARLSPEPVVLLTVTEFKPSRLDVNAVIFEMAQKYPNVSIVDWAVVTAADTTLTGKDGLHLTDPGRAALAEQVAMVLGPAPVQPGKCLTSSFRDDSSGAVTGPVTTSRPARSTTTISHSGTSQPSTTAASATVPTGPTPAPGTSTAPADSTTAAPGPSTTVASSTATTGPPALPTSGGGVTVLP